VDIPLGINRLTNIGKEPGPDLGLVRPQETVNPHKAQTARYRGAPTAP